MRGAQRPDAASRRDAGYELEKIGGLENARALEDFVPGVFIKLAPVFYRFAPAGEL